MRRVEVLDVGAMEYKAAWELQERFFQELIDRKLRNRKAPPEEREPLKHYFIICEHPHVYTLGKSGKPEHLLIGPERMQEEGISYFPINRGGDITYHGPGQIVGYPILDLDDFFTDIHKYLRLLEEMVILSLADFGISASRSAGETGVWLDPSTPNARKICAMGIKASRWITMHGFAFNHSVDLKYFDYIVPCGIADKAVASLQNETNQLPTRQAFINRLLFHFQNLFNCECHF